MKRILLGTLFALFAPLALAQNTLSLDVGVNGDGQVEVTWSTSPAADSCVATGDWSATGPSGTQTLTRISATSTFGMDCSWQGDSLATLSWTNPTQNTDDTSYDHSTGETVIVWSQNDISGLSCYDADTVNTTTRPGDETMHTVTGLDPGAWNFAAFAMNSMGVCSEISNVATKTTSGSVQVSDSVTLRVPGSPSNLDAS